MPEQVKPVNINNSFFEGYYKDIWRNIFPEKTTLAETDWIINEASLTFKSHVLDLMCGYGRHSLEIARKGVQVTAIDNLQDYINEMKEKIAIDNLPIDAICDDVIQMHLTNKFDAVICMGNSLQFFDEHDLLQLLSKVSEQLKNGGKFFINTWSISEIVFKSFKESSWSKIGDVLMLSKCRFVFHPTRMEVNMTLISDDGTREEKNGIDYIYSINELETMLNKAGFRLKDIYSIPGKKLFTVGEPRAYIVAEKFPDIFRE